MVLYLSKVRVSGNFNPYAPLVLGLILVFRAFLDYSNYLKSLIRILASVIVSHVDYVNILDGASCNT